MTTTALLTVWVVGATLLMFLIMVVGTGWRRHRAWSGSHLPSRYKRLPRTERLIGWPRAGVTLVGLAAAVWLVRSLPDYQGTLIGPGLWAGVTVVGLTLIDQLVLGRGGGGPTARRGARVPSCLPWKLIVLVILLTAALEFAVSWARGAATPDGRSHFDSWVLDGLAGSGSRHPFPGSAYTTPLLWSLAGVLLLTVGGVVLTLTRRVWRPGTRYTRLDRGLRRRTIRDLVLSLTGALSGSLALIGLDVAWAFASLGPGSTERTLVVAVSAVVGACCLVLTFWVLAQLLFLPLVAEESSRSGRRQATAEQVAAQEPARPVEAPRTDGEDLLPPLGESSSEPLSVDEGVPAGSSPSGPSGPADETGTVEVDLADQAGERPAAQAPDGSDQPEAREAETGTSAGQAAEQPSPDEQASAPEAVPGQAVEDGTAPLLAETDSTPDEAGPLPDETDSTPDEAGPTPDEVAGPPAKTEPEPAGAEPTPADATLVLAGVAAAPRKPAPTTAGRASHQQAPRKKKPRTAVHHPSTSRKKAPPASRHR